MNETLDAIAARIDGRVIGNGATLIERIAALEDVDAASLTFATDRRYLEAAVRSRAAAVLTDESLADFATDRKPLIVVASTRLALAALLQALEPRRPSGPARHPSAYVDPSARIGADVVIGPHVTIGANSTVGDRCVLGAGAVVADDAQLGSDCLVHPNVVVQERCVIGDRCILHPGAVIGADGFGFAFLDGKLIRIPQVGTVVLGDDVEIGANACVDRAQTGVTSIGDGTKIDNLVMIGHNCRVGRHSAFAAQSGVAGSTVVGDYVRAGAQSGFNGHITIGSRATIGGGAEVWDDVPEGASVSGSPARPHRERLRLQVLLEQLPKLVARVGALEKSRDGDAPRDRR